MLFIWKYEYVDYTDVVSIYTNYIMPAEVAECIHIEDHVGKRQVKKGLEN